MQCLVDKILVSSYETLGGGTKDLGKCSGLFSRAALLSAFNQTVPATLNSSGHRPLLQGREKAKIMSIHCMAKKSLDSPSFSGHGLM